MPASAEEVAFRPIMCIMRGKWGSNANLVTRLLVFAPAPEGMALPRRSDSISTAIQILRSNLEQGGEESCQLTSPPSGNP
jgi:hypothetical protein